jgi:hypothetical protein
MKPFVSQTKDCIKNINYCYKSTTCRNIYHVQTQTKRSGIYYHNLWPNMTTLQTIKTVKSRRLSLVLYGAVPKKPLQFFQNEAAVNDGRSHFSSQIVAGDNFGL